MLSCNKESAYASYSKCAVQTDVVNGGLGYSPALEIRALILMVLKISCQKLLRQVETAQRCMRPRSRRIDRTQAVIDAVGRTPMGLQHLEFGLVSPSTHPVVRKRASAKPHAVSPIRERGLCILRHQHASLYPSFSLALVTLG